MKLKLIITLAVVLLSISVSAQSVTLRVRGKTLNQGTITVHQHAAAEFATLEMDGGTLDLRKDSAEIWIDTLIYRGGFIRNRGRIVVFFKDSVVTDSVQVIEPE